MPSLFLLDEQVRVGMVPRPLRIIGGMPTSVLTLSQAA
jgi:hypothetical protein